MIKYEHENTTGLSVLECGILLERRVTDNVLAATVLELAFKQEFTLKRIENNGVVDFQLCRGATRKNNPILQPDEKLLLGILFDNFEADCILYSEIHKKVSAVSFDSRVSMRNNTARTLKQKGLMNEMGERRTALMQSGKLLGIILAFFLSIIFYVFPIYLWLNYVSPDEPLFPSLEVSAFVFLVILLITGYWGTNFMERSAIPFRLTKEGEILQNSLKGYSEYLSVAEKDRIDFHESQNAKERMQTQHLPYAVLFGVEESWLKQIAQEQ